MLSPSKTKIVAGCIALAAGLPYSIAADVVVFGPGLEGKSRPTVLVKTAATTAATPAGTRIGIVTTWDTGASRFMLKKKGAPGAFNHVTDLGLVNGAVIMPEFGPVSNMIAGEFNEDTFVNFNQANLNGASTQLATGTMGTTRAIENAQMDAVGIDVMIDNQMGIISILDPRATPIKLVNPDAVNPEKGMYGSQILLYNGLTALGASNNAPFTQFDTAALYPGRKITATPTLLGYGGLPERPVVMGVIVGTGVRGALRLLDSKPGLWDSGAPTSQIDAALVHLGAGDAPDGMIKPKMVKGTRVIIDEIRVQAGTDTLIFKDVQMNVVARPAACPFRIGMNVLEQFAWLIDLHDDININGPDRSYQLKYLELPAGKVPGDKKVSVLGITGQTVVMAWTDKNGAPLIDANLDQQFSTKVIPGGFPLFIIGEARFKAPAGAAGFTTQILTGARGVVNAKVEAGKATDPRIALDKEEGQAATELPATKRATPIWDAIQDILGGLAGKFTIPLLGLDTNRDGSFADADATEPQLQMGIDVQEYFTGLDPAMYSHEWFHPVLGGDPGDLFLIRNGRVYPCANPYSTNPVLGSPLPGIYVTMNNLEYDPLALDTDPFFLADPMSGDFVAAAVGQIGTGEGCVVAPLNDRCDTAETISVGDTVTGSTCLASVEDSLPSCGGAGFVSSGSVWYKVTGTGNMMTASLCSAATNFDSKVSVYCGACGNFTCVGGDDNSCGSGQSMVSWCSQSSNTYYIVVHGVGNSRGTFGLTLSDNAVPCAPTVMCSAASSQVVFSLPPPGDGDWRSRGSAAIVGMLYNFSPGPASHLTNIPISAFGFAADQIGTPGSPQNSHSSFTLRMRFYDGTPNPLALPAPTRTIVQDFPGFAHPGYVYFYDDAVVPVTPFTLPSDHGFVTLEVDEIGTTTMNSEVGPSIRGLATPIVGSSDSVRWADSNRDGVFQSGEAFGAPDNPRGLMLILRATVPPPPPPGGIVDLTASGCIPDSGLIRAGDTLANNSIKWYKFSLCGDADFGHHQFFSVDSEGSQPVNLSAAIYRLSGELVGDVPSDADSGSGNNFLLTFGTGIGAQVGDGRQYDGHNGSIGAGTYYLAVGPSTATFGPGLTANANGGTGGPMILNFKTNTNGTPISIAETSVAPALRPGLDLGQVFAPVTTGGPYALPAYDLDWTRFEVCTEITSPEYLDIDFSGSAGVADVMAALFDDSGNIMFMSDDNGSTNKPQFSFGDQGPRFHGGPVPFDGTVWGPPQVRVPTLAVGTYWLASSLYPLTSANDRWAVHNNSPSSLTYRADIYVSYDVCGGGSVCPFCAADYNQDGGVDGGDVSAFFPDWEAAAACADVNQDGGVDGGDVEYFFSVWESGGC